VDVEVSEEDSAQAKGAVADVVVTVAEAVVAVGEEDVVVARRTRNGFLSPSLDVS